MGLQSNLCTRNVGVFVSVYCINAASQLAKSCTGKTAKIRDRNTLEETLVFEIYLTSRNKFSHFVSLACRRASDF